MVERLTNGWVVLALMAASVGMLFLLNAGQRSVYPQGGGVSGMPTFVELQLAFDEADFKRVWEVWSTAPCATDLTVSALCHIPPDLEPITDGPAAWKRNLIRLDFVFPLVYATFFVAALGWAWRMSPVGVRRLAVVGGAVALADWVENLLHLWVLRGLDTYADVAAADLGAGAILAASWAAAFKWALLAVGLFALVAGLALRGVAAITGREDRAG
jgi:hypothetical protein